MLDIILKGKAMCQVKEGDITQMDIAILQALTDYKNGKRDLDPIIDSYILDCFDLFLFNTTNIVLNLNRIYETIYTLNKQELSFFVL